MKTRTTLRKSLKIFDVNDLPHELLLTARQKTKLRNAFNNNMSTDIKLSNSIWRILKIIIEQISRSINESSSSIGKNVLAPLRITAVASAIDAGIQKKIHGSGTTTLIISNEEMNDMVMEMKWVFNAALSFNKL